MYSDSKETAHIYCIRSVGYYLHQVWKLKGEKRCFECGFASLLTHAKTTKTISMNLCGGVACTENKTITFRCMPYLHKHIELFIFSIHNFPRIGIALAEGLCSGFYSSHTSSVLADTILKTHIQ